jgi:hypothetical protein
VASRLVRRNTVVALDWRRHHCNGSRLASSLDGFGMREGNDGESERQVRSAGDRLDVDIAAGTSVTYGQNHIPFADTERDGQLKTAQNSTCHGNRCCVNNFPTRQLFQPNTLHTANAYPYSQTMRDVAHDTHPTNTSTTSKNERRGP